MEDTPAPELPDPATVIGETLPNPSLVESDPAVGHDIQYLPPAEEA